MGECSKVLAFAALPAIGHFAGGCWPKLRIIWLQPNHELKDSSCKTP
jgi:hypothetical protein